MIESPMRTKYRSLPARSGIGRPVSWLIHHEMNSATQLSASGLQVALTYGRTPHIERLRDSRYQNCFALKCVSSSKQISGICEPCQFDTVLSCSRWAKLTDAPDGNVHDRSGATFGFAFKLG
ncbi:hypothetical protein D9M72_503760 [compost metagenome]